MASRRNPAFQEACRVARNQEDELIREAAANGELSPTWREVLAIVAIAALFILWWWWYALPPN